MHDAKVRVHKRDQNFMRGVSSFSCRFLKEMRTDRWKRIPGDLPYLIEPYLPLLLRAGDNNAEHSPVKERHSAKGDDAVFPDPFERIPKGLLLPFNRSIGRVENQCRLYSENSHGYAFTWIRFSKPVGNTRAENPVNPAFHDRRWHSPPVRMDENDPVRCCDLPAVQCNFRGESRIAGDLIIREQRIELLTVKVMDGNGMTGFQKQGCNLIRCRVVEGARVRRGKDDGNLHGSSRIISGRSP